MSTPSPANTALWEKLDSLEAFYAQAGTQEDFWKVVAEQTEADKIHKLRELLRAYPGYSVGDLAHATRILTENRAIREENERYYGNPLDTAFDLLANKRPFQTIIAGLIAGSIAPLNARVEDYTKALDRVRLRFGEKTAAIVNDAARLAFDHRPVLDPEMTRRMARDEGEYIAYMAAERDKKRQHDAEELAKVAAGQKAAPKLYKIDKRYTLHEIWNKNYAGMIRSKNYVPEASDVRLSERITQLRKIDPANATPEQKLALAESYDVHGPMALRSGLWGFYEWVGDLYVKVFDPEAYDAISTFQANLDTAFHEFKDPMSAARRRIVDALTEKGLKRTHDAAQVGTDGDFFFSNRRKSISSLWRKLHSDRVDPVAYFRELTEETSGATANDKAKIFYERVLQENIFDLYGWRLVIDPKALLEKGLIVEEFRDVDVASGKKTKGASPNTTKVSNIRKNERNACYYVRDLIAGLAAAPSKTGALLAQPQRDKNFIEHPKPENDYRSFHQSLAVPISIPSLDLHHVRIPVELQIRTDSMHEAAEFGNSAYARFRETGNADNFSWRKAAKEACDNDIYAVTPLGEIKHVGQNGTVLDFAARLGMSFLLACDGAVVYSGYRTAHPLDSFRRDNTRVLKPTDRLPNGVQVRLLKKDWAEQPTSEIITRRVNKTLLDELSRKLETPYAREALTTFRRRWEKNPEAALAKLKF